MGLSKLMTAAELAKELGVSKAYAYKVIKQMNEELKAKGFMIVAGKISRKYYEEKYYGTSEVQYASV